MTWFITRVELHERFKGDKPNYNLLHRQMAAQGFSQQITANSGTVWDLPEAEYFSQGELSRFDVLDLARAAATATGYPHSVVVTQTDGICWFGLNQ